MRPNQCQQPLIWRAGYALRLFSRVIRFFTSTTAVVTPSVKPDAANLVPYRAVRVPVNSEGGDEAEGNPHLSTSNRPAMKHQTNPKIKLSCTAPKITAAGASRQHISRSAASALGAPCSRLPRWQRCGWRAFKRTPTKVDHMRCVNIGTLTDDVICIIPEPTHAVFACFSRYLRLATMKYTSSTSRFYVRPKAYTPCHKHDLKMSIP